MQENRLWIKRGELPWSKRQWVDAVDLYHLCRNDPSQAAGIVLRLEDDRAKEIFTRIVLGYYKPRGREVGDFADDLSALASMGLM